MGDPFKASDADFHRDAALSYEHQARIGGENSVVLAQLANMHATLAVAATNVALRQCYESSNVAQRTRLGEIETAIGEIGKAMPAR